MMWLWGVNEIIYAKHLALYLVHRMQNQCLLLSFFFFFKNQHIMLITYERDTFVLIYWSVLRIYLPILQISQNNLQL